MQPAILPRSSEARVDNPALLSAHDSPHPLGFGLAESTPWCIIPVLPVGPAHKLSGNAYCERDHRREHAPPQLIYSGHTALQAGTQVTDLKFMTPGDSYVWKLSQDQPHL
uniref:NADH dehydrogenase [ubiquinone] 1 alpha subcomplex subunit 7 n=1 Tax=Eptatretus burgeri TaxID=7764 RepID=A0A8C4NKR3_EPTBU